MPAPVQLVIAVPLSAAIGRMPEALVAGSVDVVLERVAGASEWLWRSPSGGGRLALSAPHAASTALVVTADPETPAPIVDALTVEVLGALERTWAPSVPPSPAGPARRRLQIAAVVAAVLIPALAVTGARMLAPPKPLDVAAAVTQFRSEAAGGGGAAAASGATQAAADPQDGGGSASDSAPDGARRDDDTGAQRRPARTASTQGGATADRARPAAAQSSARRSQSTAGTAQRSERETRRPSPPTPDEGVYRYATQGYESIDQPSSRHDYPRETAMTIRHNDCGGFVAHWQPLENRWDEMTICSSSAGSFIPTMATHREFYGQQKDSRYTCSKGYYAYRPETGATWTGRCTDKESQMQIQGRTLGREAMRVGDQTVQTVHYVVEARITGDNEGTWRAERWVDPKTLLLVRARANTDATSKSSFGTVRYHEETDVRLLSMTPER